MHAKSYLLFIIKSLIHYYWALKKLNFQWQKGRNANSTNSSQIFEELGFSPVMVTLLNQKGINNIGSAKRYFLPTLDQLHNPFHMKNMQKAVLRIALALEKNQKILIYGDYDVDGTTSVVLVFSFLKELGAQVDYYIPEREKEGYGISQQGIHWAKENNSSLIIALDCGIRSIELIDYANDLGIDFIVCDHHLPGEILPKAHAILNPKQKDCKYPFKELSGCGIGFKLCQALAEHFHLNIESYTDKIDLVAVSIASDLVEMTDENRVLTYLGMKKLAENPFGGLKLFRDLVIGNRPVKTHDLVFKIGPRINAAGRIWHAKQAVRTMLEGGQEHFDKLNSLNKKRQELDKEVSAEALSLIKKDAKSTVVYQKHWHKGVIGIVASRLLEYVFRPTIVLTEKSDQLLVGSARSIPNFDMHNGLNQCADILEQFGGHYYAAGLTVKKDNLPAFEAKFEQIVLNTLSEEDFIPKATYDAELKMEDITGKLAAEIEKMAPFGPRNMRPVFLLKKVVNYRYQLIGQDKDHLKLEILYNKSTIPCIAFGMAQLASMLDENKAFDLYFHLEINMFRDQKNLQLEVIDIKF